MNKNKSGKKSSVFVWIIIAIAVLAELASEGDEEAAVIAAVILTLFILIFIISKLKKSSAAKREHTHDSLDKVNFNASESVSEHYLLQLNSFLKAGIIDRKEYNEIIRRYSQK